MKNEQKKIVRVKTKRGMGKELSKLFDVTQEYVSRCMSGDSNTELANKIRKVAVGLGGDPIYESINI